MYFIKKQQIIFFLLFVIFVGCSPIEKIETETLQPAEISLPKHFKRVGFILSYPENEFKLVDQDNFKKDILKEVKYGISEITANSPRFIPSDILFYEFSDLTSKDSIDNLSISRLDQFADSLLLDGLIILNNFSLNSRLKKDYGFGYSGGFYFNFKITSKAKWRIYNKFGNTYIDSFSYKEQYVWEVAASSEREALSKLPEYNQTFRKAAYWTAHDYAKRILPIWEKNQRIYYVMGNKIMKTASEKAKNNNWKEAINLWKRNLTHYDDELVSRSAYNIAIAFEMMGKIDLAMKWAKKAHEINSKKRALQYYIHLKQRKEKLSKLENQLP